MSVAVITDTKQYLTFKLGEEVFGLDVGEVREILDFSSVTRVPQMPDFMLGVINLRGNVVPVIDMRLKFGMSKTEKTVNTCIVVVELKIEGVSTIIGALVDSVQEVFDLEPSQIEPPPKIGMKLRTDFIRGMGKHSEEFIILLDIDRVFSADELVSVRETATGGNGEN